MTRLAVAAGGSGNAAPGGLAGPFPELALAG
jgi:hypothetical protein